MKSEKIRVKSAKKKVLKFNGITLISLVITIVILIILAGVGINLSLGENGIFKRAKQAKNMYLTAEEKEQQELNELYAILNENNLPENTPETDAGTKVKMPNGWYTTTPNYVSTDNGKIVKKSIVSSTVYAVSDGNANTIPVPVGFYYVGGNLNTGIVISDNKEDEYKTGIDKTSHEYSGKLKGNQFVWIPCTKDEYRKMDWVSEDVKWDMETNCAEYIPISKYGGFYIGRYEAGVSTLNIETNKFEDSVKFENNKSLFSGVTGNIGINSWARTKLQLCSKTKKYNNRK